MTHETTIVGWSGVFGGIRLSLRNVWVYLELEYPLFLLCVFGLT